MFWTHAFAGMTTFYRNLYKGYICNFQVPKGCGNYQYTVCQYSQCVYVIPACSQREVSEFTRLRSSGPSKMFWIPAFAGMTTFYRNLYTWYICNFQVPKGCFGWVVMLQKPYL